MSDALSEYPEPNPVIAPVIVCPYCGLRDEVSSQSNRIIGKVYYCACPRCHAELKVTTEIQFKTEAAKHE